MSEHERNPFDAETPEWQLFENMIGARRAASAFAGDAARAQAKAKEQREKEARFQSALDRLAKDTPTP